MNIDNAEASSPWGVMAYLQGGLPWPFKPMLLFKCCTNLAAFVNDSLLDSSRTLLEGSSGDGSKQHMENDRSAKFSYPHAATSSLFNFLFDFLFQATM